MVVAMCSIHSQPVVQPSNPLGNLASPRPPSSAVEVDAQVNEGTGGFSRDVRGNHERNAEVRPSLQRLQLELEVKVSECQRASLQKTY